MLKKKSLHNAPKIFYIQILVYPCTMWVSVVGSCSVIYSTILQLNSKYDYATETHLIRGYTKWQKRFGLHWRNYGSLNKRPIKWESGWYGQWRVGPPSQWDVSDAINAINLLILEPVSQFEGSQVEGVMESEIGCLTLPPRLGGSSPTEGEFWDSGLWTASELPIID